MCRQNHLPLCGLSFEHMFCYTEFFYYNKALIINLFLKSFMVCAFFVLF